MPKWNEEKERGQMENQNIIIDTHSDATRQWTEARLYYAMITYECVEMKKI